MTSQGGASLCMLDKQCYTRARIHMPTRPGIRTHACARAHTEKYVIRISFPRQKLFADAPQHVIRTLFLFLVYKSVCVSPAKRR